MKIYIIFFILVNLISCSPPSSFSDNSDLNESSITEDTTLDKEEIVPSIQTNNIKRTITTKRESCYEGCNFYNRTFTVVKEVKKNSLSLNNTQIDSLYSQCKAHCLTIFKNDVILKKQIEKEEPIIDHNKEKKKRNSSLTPFEDL
jgi:hypothetical protein